MLRAPLFIIILSLLTACTGSAYKLPDVKDSDIKAINNKYDEESKRPLKTYTRSDHQNKAILQDVTKKLTKNAKPLCEYADYNSCHFEVSYDPDSTVNAYASDGYKITIFRGILEYLKTNDEFAAVVAHEMGHHLAKHNEETARNAKVGAAISGTLTAILIGAANANNPYANNYYQQQRDQQLLEDMMKLGAHVGVRSYSKDQEREADLLATYLLSNAGYNLEKAQNVMVVLSRFAGEADPNRKAFLDSHPAGIERVASWEKAIEEINNNPQKLPYLKQAKVINKKK
jgi:predicted Zn-dependent protease